MARTRGAAAMPRPLFVGKWLVGDEAPGMCEALALPVVRARGAHCKTALRQAGAKHWLCQWLSRLRFYALPMAGRLRFHASPKALPLAPRPCCQRRGNGFANGRVRSRFAGRAPCAPHWQANVPHMGKRSAKKRAARGMAGERDVLRTGPFPCRWQRNGP